ncbi:MAG: hypothetical protein FWC56_03335 [Phycisphaerae bacterium]|nr:hypothetical protein [Phycisphaerae bacterium]
MSHLLVTAPYVGEIGWELMSWQGRVRKIFHQGQYDRVIVLGSAGKSAFYEGIPLEYRDVDLSDLPGSACEDRRMEAETSKCLSAEQLRHHVNDLVQSVVDEQTAIGHRVDVLWPSYDGTLWPCHEPYQTFVKYQRSITERPKAPWVVLVQRTRLFGNKNWSSSNWADLQQRLESNGVHTSVYPCDSEAAIAMLSGCDLAVGQTTGGLHLASLCDCPVMAWSFYDALLWNWEITNRQRFETWWNPFGALVAFHHIREFPTPEVAANQVMRALNTIGRRTGSRLHRIAYQCNYAIQSSLARHVIEPKRYRRWPWPIQKWVRYQLARA